MANWSLVGPVAHLAAGIQSVVRLVEGTVHDRVTRADRYKEEALRCHEMARHADPPFLREFYRRIAVRYLFMAEENPQQSWGFGREPPEAVMKIRQALPFQTARSPG